MICVDASVAAKWIFPEEHSERASGLLRKALDEGESVIAPPLLPVEVSNIIRQRMRRGILDREGARTILSQFLDIPIALQAPQTLHERALLIAVDHELPAVYDAHYIALAELFGATLWSADQRLIRTLNGRLPFVRSIADWRRQ